MLSDFVFQLFACFPIKKKQNIDVKNIALFE